MTAIRTSFVHVRGVQVPKVQAGCFRLSVPKRKHASERLNASPSSSNLRSETKFPNQCVLFSAIFRRPVSLRLHKFNLLTRNSFFVCSVCETFQAVRALHRHPATSAGGTRRFDSCFDRDMPPAGGFENVKYKRNLPFRGPSGLVILGGVTAVCAYGFYRVGLGNLEKR